MQAQACPIPASAFSTATAAKDLSSVSSQCVCTSILFPHSRNHGSVKQNPSIHYSVPCPMFPTAKPYATPRCEREYRIFQFLSPSESADIQKMAVTEKKLTHCGSCQRSLCKEVELYVVSGISFYWTTVSEKTVRKSQKEPEDLAMLFVIKAIIFLYSDDSSSSSLEVNFSWDETLNPSEKLQHGPWWGWG